VDLNEVMDLLVEAWHKSNSKDPFWIYIGMPKQTYIHWFETGRICFPYYEEEWFFRNRAKVILGDKYGISSI
jgi:bifunctional pyridoxal-dependent enzyme with beta-cystathionase and maltose regulon repressor activities